jgi:prepilin-type processing-associated H-X9-DG protein
MQHKRGLSLLHVIAVIFAIAFLLAIMMPSLGKVKKIHPRIVCGTNLKGLGTACSVYSDDYDDRFPQLPGSGPWSKQLGFAYNLAEPDFKKGGAQSNVDRTIPASWYLLVREADVSPKNFVCPLDGGITVFDDGIRNNPDIVLFWDFGSEPHKHVSYAMQNPYGAFPATGKRPDSFPLAADMSPWFHLGDFVKPDAGNKDWRLNRILLPPYYSDKSIALKQIQQSNALPHKREGQNVMFADGHSEFVKTPDVGVNHDNIYTFWSTPTNPTEKDIRIGTNPTSRSKENDAQSPDDSFLAI